jgi:hypothetical protein
VQERSIASLSGKVRNSASRSISTWQATGMISMAFDTNSAQINERATGSADQRLEGCLIPARLHFENKATVALTITYSHANTLCRYQAVSSM